MEMKADQENRSERQEKKYMNPFLAGFLIGLMLLVAFYFSGRGLGASGAVKSVVVAGLNEVAPAHTAESAFFGKYVHTENNPLKNWLVLQGLGVLVGGFLSGVWAGRLKLTVEHMPKITAKRRLWFALAGGIITGVGSQLGRGCTSGAALTGMTNLSLAGFVSLIAIFGTAGALAYFFRKNWLM